MNILLISRCPPYPLHLGDRLIIWHLARTLAQKGHTLDLLALTQYQSDANEISHYAPFFRDISLFSETKRSQWMYLQRLLRWHFPQDAQSAWQTEMWQAIEEKLSGNDYDVVHLFGGIQVYEFAHLLKDVPSIITPYESYSLYLKRALQQKHNPSIWLNRQITRRFERWMFSPYDRTVVLTKADKEELLGINPQLNIDVIPNGIDLDAFQPQETTRASATLLFVGNYEYPPNHDAALLLARDIFPQILESIPTAKLQLVGNAPSDEMKQYASDHIEITGRVPAVQEYLATASMFVSPLRIGAGIKNKILEALAMGIPTIATPLSVEGIAVENGKHLLVSEVEAFSKTVLSLLKNPDLQKNLSENAPALIEAKYSWQGVAHQYESLYHALVKR